MLPPAVAKSLEQSFQPQLSTLFELLGIPSIANNADDGCDRAANWLIEHFRSIGMQAEILHGPGRSAVLAERHVSNDVPTILFYGHYDVQPPDPLDKWLSPPFEPTIRDGCIYCRGVSDNKGSSWAFIMAIEAWLASGEPLPLNIKIIYEGEEEIGSPTVDEILRRYGDRLQADVCIVTDGGFYDDVTPAIIYALRGLTYFEVTMRGANADVHSGTNGGIVANPVNALARLLAAMHDDSGRIMLEGIYDQVAPISDAERAEWAKLNFDEAAYARHLGLGALTAGEAGLPALERRWARPTLDCNGFWGGYTGSGAKTIIPAQATMKISLRIPPNLQPEHVASALRKFVAEHTPPGLHSDVREFAHSRPVMLKPPAGAVTAMRQALSQAFGSQAAMIRMGATIPIVESIQRLLHLDAIVTGISGPSDNLHSPNERLSIESLRRGAQAAADFLARMAQPG